MKRSLGADEETLTAQEAAILLELLSDSPDNEEENDLFEANNPEGYAVILKLRRMSE